MSLLLSLRLLWEKTENLHAIIPGHRDEIYFCAQVGIKLRAGRLCYGGAGPTLACRDI